MTRHGFLGPVCVLLAATLSRAESEDAARQPVVMSPESAGPSVKPTLEWLRDVIVKRGVPPRLVRIEHPEEGPASSSGQRPRLVFWTRTRRITQTVVVAIIGKSGGERSQRYVRIQSARLGQAPADHPRLAGVMSYLLDRNFAMTGAAFARDAADGEIVLRAELPVGKGLTEGEFARALEILLRLADEEAPRLEGMLGGDAGGQGVESSPVSDTPTLQRYFCHRGHRGHRERHPFASSVNSVSSVAEASVAVLVPSGPVCRNRAYGRLGCLNRDASGAGINAIHLTGVPSRRMLN